MLWRLSNNVQGSYIVLTQFPCFSLEKGKRFMLSHVKQIIWDLQKLVDKNLKWFHYMVFNENWTLG